MNLNMGKNFLHKAFTLAEVLIVIGIIGLVAEMTIPSLVDNFQKQLYASSLKAIYSQLYQATNMLITDNGGNMVGGIYSTPNNATNVVNAYCTKLNCIKICGTGQGCWYNAPLRTLSGDTYHSSLNVDTMSTYGALGQVYEKAVLKNGMSIAFGNLNGSYGGDCDRSEGNGPIANSCGQILVDVNGLKPPNRSGRDVFWLLVTQTGIYPCGTSYEPALDYSTNCNPNSHASDQNGGSCAGRVISEGAMNY